MLGPTISGGSPAGNGRVKAGFPYLERRGFEEAIDACGEVSVWKVFSEVPVPGTILGRDDAGVRQADFIGLNTHGLSTFETRPFSLATALQ